MELGDLVSLLLKWSIELIDHGPTRLAGFGAFLQCLGTSLHFGFQFLLLRSSRNRLVLQPFRLLLDLLNGLTLLFQKCYLLLVLGSDAGNIQLNGSTLRRHLVTLLLLDLSRFVLGIGNVL